MPYIVIGLAHEEPANFYREKQRVAFVTGHLCTFSGGFISHLFISIWKSDHMKARNSIKNDCGRLVKNQI